MRHMTGVLTASTFPRKNTTKRLTAAAAKVTPMMMATASGWTDSTSVKSPNSRYAPSTTTATVLAAAAESRVTSFTAENARL